MRNTSYIHQDSPFALRENSSYRRQLVGLAYINNLKCHAPATTISLLHSFPPCDTAYGVRSILYCFRVLPKTADVKACITCGCEADGPRCCDILATPAQPQTATVSTWHHRLPRPSALPSTFRLGNPLLEPLSSPWGFADHVSLSLSVVEKIPTISWSARSLSPPRIPYFQHSSTMDVPIT